MIALTKLILTLGFFYQSLRYRRNLYHFFGLACCSAGWMVENMLGYNRDIQLSLGIFCLMFFSLSLTLEADIHQSICAEYPRYLQLVRTCFPLLVASVGISRGILIGAFVEFVCWTTGLFNWIAVNVYTSTDPWYISRIIMRLLGLTTLSISNVILASTLSPNDWMVATYWIGLFCINFSKTTQVVPVNVHRWE